MKLVTDTARLAAALLLTLLVALNVAAEEGNMIVGDAAPDFSLPDQSGAMRGLAEFRGKWVVLYFYPKDDTPGCTKEACTLRDDYLGLTQLNAQVLGVSLDSAESHAAFSKKFGLPFPLLADDGGRVARQYGALGGFWPLRFAKRHTFVIDPRGNVARIYRDVDPGAHSRELIADLRALQQAAGP
jgi:peroxiredoxin Q/BCP